MIRGTGSEDRRLRNAIRTTCPNWRDKNARPRDETRSCVLCGTVGAVTTEYRFFTDLSTAPEAAKSARDHGQSELVAPWPTSVSAAASVHRACLARGEGRP